MTVGAYGRAASIGNLLSECRRFGLAQQAARQIIDDVAKTVLGWQSYFRVSGVSDKDIDTIAGAFLPESFFSEKPPPR